MVSLRLVVPWMLVMSTLVPCTADAANYYKKATSCPVRICDLVGR